MNEGKRKIGEYTVLCSVNVGEKEVILASNEQSTNGDKFMCGFAERNDLFELCSECMVSDDYIEIVHLFGSRVANEAELFKEQVEKLDIPITLITEADCTVVNNLSDFIFGLIRAIGLILLGFGIVQVGLSLKSHDPSQRANGFLTLAGGIIITFAKEILTLITG